MQEKSTNWEKLIGSVRAMIWECVSSSLGLADVSDIPRSKYSLVGQRLLRLPFNVVASMSGEPRQWNIHIAHIL